MERDWLHRRRAAGAQRRARSGALTLIRAAASVIAMAAVILRLGWEEPWLAPGTLLWIEAFGLAVYALTIIASMRADPGGRSRIARAARANGFECAVLAFGFVFVWSPMILASAVTLLFLYQALSLYLWVVQTSAPPGLVFVGSFLALIAAGTGGLMLPNSTPADAPIGLVDAVFTATSAISQTGLVVRPTGDGFTRLGHIIILILIQVGALGVIVFGALLAQVVGSSFGLRATQTIAEGTEQGWSGQLSLKRLVVFILVMTHATEAVGAAALFLGWPESWSGAPWGDGPAAWTDRAFHAVFFSVSGFCNAGFVTTSNSMQGLRAHWSTHGMLAGLIVLGSIGFPVLDNIRRVVWARIRGRITRDGALVRLTLNTKIILSATAAIYIFGFAMIVIGELTQTDEPAGLVLLDAHFMTINRTSGFDSIAPDQMGLLSRLALIFLMFVGGSPGSVAGGIKMMVFAVLALAVWSTLRGKPRVEAFGRTIPDEIVRKSATLIVMSLAVVMATTGVLVATETGPEAQTLGPYLFEATSAFGTTGLSLGITPTLEPPGKIAITVAMFVGRVGPLAVVAALLAIGLARRPGYEYPAEEVVIY